MPIFSNNQFQNCIFYQIWSKSKSVLGDYSKTIGTNFKMVCGSDGKTYSNSAILEAWSCNSGTKITKVSGGKNFIKQHN